jgi:phosphoesterase RecJ-like protein
MTYDKAPHIQQIIEKAQRILIVQADNPDGDSLGSALAMEQIISDMGKEPLLYCAVDMPGYLKYMNGWDRVYKDLPKEFDASIIVDASTMTLFERLTESGDKGLLASKPCIVLDHHQVVEHEVPFATVMINDHSRASAGELIYLLSKQLKWPLNQKAQEFLMTSILGDTQGLSNQLASPLTYRVMAEMIEAGVDRPALEELRREFGKMPQVIFKYKAQLIAHTEFAFDGRIATVQVPQVEINQYSPLYNPGPLVQNDLLQTKDVQVAIVFKTYDNGTITGAIRCNGSAAIGSELAKQFGGGGHAFAAGFKMNTSKPFNEVKSECITYAIQLLAKLDEDTPDEPIQYAYQTD